MHPQGWRFQAWKTADPLGGLAPSVQAEIAHLSLPVPLQQSCRPGGLASQTTPGPEGREGGMWPTSPTSCGGPAQAVSVCVCVCCTGAKADGPETSPGWPCFLGPTLRSWEAVPCAVLGSDMDTRPLISQMPTESEPTSVWQMSGSGC